MESNTRSSLGLRFFIPLQFWITNCSHSEFARQARFLNTENEILREKLPRRITLTSDERTRLMKFRDPLGKVIQGYCNFVLSRITT